MRLVAATLVICAIVTTATVNASIRDIQTFAIVESVVFEPNERTPERIRIHGVFAFLSTNQQPARLTGPYAPQRGYLYFKLPETKLAQEAAKKEWADLKTVAGTGQTIMFGSWTSGYWGLARDSRDVNGFVSTTEPNEALRVLTATDRRGSPITYTMDTGIVKVSETGRHAVVVQQLKDVLKQ